MSLSQSHYLNHGFNRLTWVDSGYFLGYFFLIDLFFILSFNIGLVEN
jgi:hypothetical protein